MKLTPSPFAPERFPDLPAVKGVKAATGSRGFYRGAERDDVFLFEFVRGTTCAGVFTRSATASADVDWCRKALRLGGGQARGLAVNSGNSNAFTGAKGVEKNEATLSAMTSAFKAEKSQCFLAATGVIGEPLADPNVVGAVVPDLAARAGPPAWEACARAFMTTDTFPKGAGERRHIGGVDVALAGIAKGSGMIAPNMATMLAYVFTDAAVAPDLLDALVRETVDRTFNCVTVDGDTSTSDTFMVFATAASGAPILKRRDDPRCDIFAESLLGVADALALQLVEDGEGASKVVTIEVTGGASPRSAKTVACAIANSPLVKTALAAGDANWGRIVMATGKAMEPLNKEALTIRFGDLLVAAGGARAPGYDEARASAICSQPRITICVDLGVGDGAATVRTCDLTHAYVDINGAYRT